MRTAHARTCACVGGFLPPLWFPSTLSAQLFEGYTFLRQGLMLDTPPHVIKNDVELLLLLPLSQVQTINVWLACSNLFLLIHFYSYLVQT